MLDDFALVSKIQKLALETEKADYMLVEFNELLSECILGLERSVGSRQAAKETFSEAGAGDAGDCGSCISHILKGIPMANLPLLFK